MSAFIAGRVTYDDLVRTLKKLAVTGSKKSAVRQAVEQAAAVGRIPADLRDVLVSMLAAIPTPPDNGTTMSVSEPPPVHSIPGKEAQSSGAGARDAHDDPTVPYALASKPSAPLVQHPSQDHSGPERGHPSSMAGPSSQPMSGGETAAPGPEPSPSAGHPMAQPMPPMPTYSASSDSNLPPLPEPGGYLGGSHSMPDAVDGADPEHDAVRGKVEDVVLSSLVADFQGLRKARLEGTDAQIGRSGKPDALDGLLVNFKSARFRSDAKKAASGQARNQLNLGKLDDFGESRAGLGSILRDRFILDAEVGRGGMGIVYSAVDRRRLEAGSAEPYVALKLLNDDFRNNADALRVLEAEARKAQILAHPNIATVYDFDRDRSEVFIVMELLTGKPLSRHLSAAVGQGLPGSQIVRILKGICSALSFAHSHGIIHSDLKPGNVFIAEDGAAKVLDFGLASAGVVINGFDVESLNAMTAPYASPEMFDGAPRDPRDDVFALGCIAYELLMGVHPFSMRPSNEAAETGMIPDPIMDLDPTAWEAIRRALSFDRASRTPSVDMFFDAVFEA
ncbi:MAG: protein kinase [Pseudomonadota bacterium]